MLRPERRVSGARAVALAAAVVLSTQCVLPSSVAAQEPRDSVPPADSVFTVRGLTVQVTRPVATAGGASAIRASLDSLPSPPAPTLEEVLRRLPLIQIRENSRGEAQPQLRGMESRQVAVLVDGVPLTLGWDNRTDLSVIPLTAARELTVVRGLSSVLHGPNALGGVVLVALAEGSAGAREPPRLQFNSGLDHRGNGGAALGLGARFAGDGGDLVVRAGGGYRNRSSLPLASGIAQPLASDDRLNSDFEEGNGYLVARYQRKDGRWLSLSSFGFAAERGVPPELDVQEPRLWRYPRTSRWVTALSAGTAWGRTPWGEGDLEASLGLDFGATDIDTYETLAFDSITGGEEGDDRTITLRLLGDHTLGRGILRGALTLAETRHKELIEPDERATYRQRLWSLGLEVEQPLRLSASRVPRARVSAGLSVDGADTPETGGQPARDAIVDWGARAGGTVALGRGDLLLHGGVSRRVRFPALRELYSGALGRFVVNENLDPEVLGVAELGLTANVGALETQVVTFYQRLTDAIVRVSLADGRFQRQNRDEITSVGVELLANYEWDRFSLAGDVTLKDVNLDDPSAPSGQTRPEYQPWIAGGLQLSALLPLELRGAARLRHVGSRYCVNPDLDTNVRLDADSWLDLDLARGFALTAVAPGRRAELVLAADNVSDAAVYDQCGLPQPGRLWRVQLRVF